MRFKIFLVNSLWPKLGTKARVVALVKPEDTTETGLRQSLTEQGFKVLEIKEIAPKQGDTVLEEALQRFDQIFLTLTHEDSNALHLIITEIAGQGSVLGANYVADMLATKVQQN